MPPFDPKNKRPHTIYMREWRKRNHDKWKAYQRKYRQDRRRRVLEHYGGICACCGESQYEFLAVDHANGGGEKHRTELGNQGSVMVEWIIRQDFPEGFRVLCHNCNSAIGYYGQCPHERSLKIAAGKE